ncbi:MAG: hypothetical protein ACTS2F_02885 [Thainema sp.]
MSFCTQLTRVFAKFFSSSKNGAAYPQNSNGNADSEQPNSHVDDESAPEIMTMGLRPIPRNSRRPQGRRGRAGSW